MLSLEQYQIIEDQLSKETAKEFVKTLVWQYANTEDNISDLLQYIPKLAERQLQIKQKRINQYSWATDLLIGDRYNNPRTYKKSRENGRFCMLLYVCQAHFKNGNAKHDSISGKAFFDELIQMLKDKKVFDYTKTKDWDWVYTVAMCPDWLESVIQQNIDEKFIQPKKVAL